MYNSYYDVANYIFFFPISSIIPFFEIQIWTRNFTKKFKGRSINTQTNTMNFLHNHYRPYQLLLHIARAMWDKWTFFLFFCVKFNQIMMIGLRICVCILSTHHHYNYCTVMAFKLTQLYHHCCQKRVLFRNLNLFLFNSYLYWFSPLFNQQI
jgi:hypothetical protein